MNKEIKSLAVSSDKKAERITKARNTVEVLSEIITGRPSEIEESFYARRFRGIDAAYAYLKKRTAYRKEQLSINATLKLAFGFLFGMLFGAIITNMAIIRGVFKL